MKASLLAVALLGLLLLGSADVRAQTYSPYYDPYWDVQYQQYLHYQRYLQSSYIWSHITRIKHTRPAATRSAYPDGQRLVGYHIGSEVEHHKRLGVDELSRNGRLQ
jgi:hypothetical protein